MKLNKAKDLYLRGFNGEYIKRSAVHCCNPLPHKGPIVGPSACLARVSGLAA